MPPGPVPALSVAALVLGWAPWLHAAVEIDPTCDALLDDREHAAAIEARALTELGLVGLEEARLVVHCARAGVRLELTPAGEPTRSRPVEARRGAELVDAIVEGVWALTHESTPEPMPPRPGPSPAAEAPRSTPPMPPRRSAAGAHGSVGAIGTYWPDAGGFMIGPVAGAGLALGSTVRLRALGELRLPLSPEGPVSIRAIDGALAFALAPRSWFRVGAGIVAGVLLARAEDPDLLPGRQSSFILAGRAGPGFLLGNRNVAMEIRPELEVFLRRGEARVNGESTAVLPWTSAVLTACVSAGRP